MIFNLFQEDGVQIIYTLWHYHAKFMIIGLTSLIVGFLIARYKKENT